MDENLQCYGRFTLTSGRIHLLENKLGSVINVEYRPSSLTNQSVPIKTYLMLLCRGVSVYFARNHLQVEHTGK